MSAQSEWETQVQENEEFLAGAQFTEEQIRILEKRGQAPVPINVVYQVVNQAVGMLTANNPRFQATGREDSDTQRGRLAGQLCDWVWHNSRGNSVLKRACFDNYTSDRGVLMAYIDPSADFGQGEVMIGHLKSTEVYPDPHSRDPHWRDASAIYVHRVMTDEQIFAHWGIPKSELGSPRVVHASGSYMNRAKSEGQHVGPNAVDTTAELYSTIERYTKVPITFYRVSEKPTGEIKVLNEEEYEEYVNRIAFIVHTVEGQEYVVDEDEALEVQSVVQTYGDTIHYEVPPPAAPGEQPEPEIVPGPETGQNPNEIPGSTTQFEAVTIGALIQARVILSSRTKVTRVKRDLIAGDHHAGSHIMQCDDYPLKPITSNHTGNPYPTPDVAQVKGIQQSINKHHMLILAHAASSTNLKVFIPEGTVNKKTVEEEFGRAGVGVIEFDADSGMAPVIAQPTPLNSQLYANIDRLVNFIYTLFGIYPFQQGDVTGAPDTYKGTVLMDENAMRRIKSKIADMDESLSQLGRVVVQLCQGLYTTEKVIRLVQPNGTTEEVVLNQPVYDTYQTKLLKRINDITIGHYDVQVVSGSTLPSSRWALLDYYRELYRDGLIDQQEVLMKAEVFDAEKVLGRFSQMNQMQQIIEQQQQAIKDLEGDLQTARREVIHAKQDAILTKFKSSVDRDEVRTSAAATLVQQRLQDQLTIQKQEANA